MTILFVDIVGSTELAERFDAEDWKGVIDPVLAGFTSAIERHGGHVAQLLGDGLLAFFGAPVAHEDDPLRAIRAGLDILGTLSDLTPDGGPGVLRARVGINSGEVVVGRLGGGRHREYLAVGDAVNVAARLQSAARPMTVLVAADTFRRAAGAVEGIDRGPIALKGKADAVRAFEVISVHDERGRGRMVLPAADLVGRDVELGRLVEASERLGRGRGGLVRITGEPGIGKTRLLEAWRASLPVDGPGAVRWVSVACRTTGAEIPYDLTTALVRGILGIDGRTSLRASRAAMRAAVAGLGRLDAALVGWLAGIQPTRGERSALAGLEGRVLQQRAAVALRTLLELAARRTPLLIAAEDAHWADPSSAELLASAFRAALDAPLLICITARPETSAALTRLDRSASDLPPDALTPVVLSPLAPSAQTRLVAQLLDGAPTASLVDLVAGRADGNPLFIEELLAVLRERGLLTRREDAWHLADVDPTLVPPGLIGLLVARLDALPRPVRRLAQVAAVIGRSASLETVRAVAIDAGDSAVAAVDDPVADAMGLLARGAEPGSITFRHALVHDAAYSLLAHADQRRLHGLAACRLEREADAVGRLPEASAGLARHFAAAVDHPAAARLGRIAAAWAAGRYANEEAISAYAIAIDATRAMLAAGGGGPAARSELAELLLAQGRITRRGGAFTETELLVGEAAALRSDAQPLEQARWQAELAICANDRCAYEEEEDRLLAAEALLALATSQDPEWWSLWIDVRAARAQLAYWLARVEVIAELLASLEEPIARHGSTDQQSTFESLYTRYLLLRDSFAPSAETMAHAGRAYALERRSPRLEGRGWAELAFGFANLFNRDTAAAISHLGQALATADILHERLLEARTTTYLAVAYRLARQVDQCAAMTARARDVCERLAIEQYIAAALGNEAWLRLPDGDPSAVLRLADEAARRWPESPPSPLHWLDTWPAMAAHAALGEPLRAAERSQVLLWPGQWPPPREVGVALLALHEAAADPAGDVAAALADALTLAQEAGLL